MCIFKTSGIYAQIKIERFEGGNKGYKANDFITFNNLFFFTSVDSDGIRKTYFSNGTAYGTKLLKNVTTSAYSGSADQYSPNWTICGDNLFFLAHDSINGRELWVTKGTQESTRLVKNITTRDSSTKIFYMYSLSNGKLLFSVYPSDISSSSNIQFWTSDGTEIGTQSYYETKFLPHPITFFNDKMYFGTYGELWVTDGTLNGTKLLKNLKEENPNAEIPYINGKTSSKLFFVTSIGVGLSALWVSDGTTLGTKIIKQGDSNSYFQPDNNLTNLNEKIIFSAQTKEIKNGLWISDGTSIGTKIIKDLGITSLRNLTPMNNILIFSLYRNGYYDLWGTDGTLNGTDTIMTSNKIQEFSVDDPPTVSTRYFYT